MKKNFLSLNKKIILASICMCIFGIGGLMAQLPLPGNPPPVGQNPPPIPPGGQNPPTMPPAPTPPPPPNQPNPPIGNGMTPPPPPGWGAPGILSTPPAPGWENQGNLNVMATGYDSEGVLQQIPLYISYFFNGVNYNVTVLNSWNPYSQMWNSGVDIPASQTSYFLNGFNYNYEVILPSGTYYFNL